jgi:hypothetical protein
MSTLHVTRKGFPGFDALVAVLGVVFGEGFGPILADKPSTMVFHFIEVTIRDKVVLVSAIIARPCLLHFYWCT